LIDGISFLSPYFSSVSDPIHFAKLQRRMKFPSIFRTASPMRFDIKPRYYDPIKEEIEERTARIKSELEQEGVLERELEDGDLPSYKGSLRGSFAQYRGIKPKGSNLIGSTAVIRTLLFLAMILGCFGYIYLGPVVLDYLLYSAVAVAVVFFGFRFLKRGKKDD
jgi:hypothetical protein